MKARAPRPRPRANPETAAGAAAGTRPSPRRSPQFDEVQPRRPARALAAAARRRCAYQPTSIGPSAFTLVVVEELDRVVRRADRGRRARGQCGREM